jgi:hypothetical protein
MVKILSLKHTKLNLHSREAIVFGICLIAVFLFLYTASNKIIDHISFFKGLKKVEIIWPYALIVSWLVPISEIVVAIMLLFPKTMRVGLYCFLILMIVFTGYILSMLLWAEKLPCRCGGVIEKLTWVQHVWFNLTFIILAVLGLWLSNSKSRFKIQKNEKL